MKYEVRCTARDCYLRNPVPFADPAMAEVLAYAHEQRWLDAQEPHVVILQDLNDVQPSEKPEASTGEKGGANG